MSPIPPNQQTAGVDEWNAESIRHFMAAGRPVVITMKVDAMAAYRDGDPRASATPPTRHWRVRRARGLAPFIGYPADQGYYEWKVATEGPDQVAGDARLVIVNHGVDVTGARAASLRGASVVGGLR